MHRLRSGWASVTRAFGRRQNGLDAVQADLKSLRADIRLLIEAQSQSLNERSRLLSLVTPSKRITFRAGVATLVVLLLVIGSSLITLKYQDATNRVSEIRQQADTAEIEALQQGNTAIIAVEQTLLNPTGAPPQLGEVNSILDDIHKSLSLVDLLRATADRQERSARPFALWG